MSKKSRLKKCPKCRGDLHEINSFHDGIELECERCGWIGTIHGKSSKEHGRKIKEITSLDED